LTLVSATNAVVSIPAFPFGTFNPVTATFTRPNPSQPVDFTLRASARLNTVLIRAQCAAPVGPEGAMSRNLPDVGIWLPNQTAVGIDGLLSVFRYAVRPPESANEE